MIAPIESMTQMVVRKRCFVARDFDDLRRIMTELKLDKFTGDVTIHMNCGGIQIVEAKDQKKLAP